MPMMSEDLIPSRQMGHSTSGAMTAKLQNGQVYVDKTGCSGDCLLMMSAVISSMELRIAASGYHGAVH